MLHDKVIERLLIWLLVAVGVLGLVFAAIASGKPIKATVDLDADQITAPLQKQVDALRQQSEKQQKALDRQQAALEAIRKGKPAPSPPIRIGMNLGAPNYYSSTLFFSDVMKYHPQLYDGKYYAFRNIDGHYPHGKYTATHDGDGTVKVEDIGNQVIITPTPTVGDVSNLHVYMPGYGPGEKHWGQKFYQPFLDKLKPFSPIRFMDSLATNNSDVVTWADRSDTPMPIEDAVDLCNALHADAWFNMPHKANDDYVRHFAELAHQRLDPGLKVYVEYSNECWNAYFKQWSWLGEQKSVLGAKSEMEAAGIEAKRDFAIWSDVFKADPDRLIRVAATQTVNTWQTRQLIKGLGGDVSKGDPGDCDAVAITFYAGLVKGTKPSADSTPADIVASVHAEMARLKPLWRAQANLAAKIGVPLIAYEGGLAVQPNQNDPPWGDALRKLEESPEAATLTRELIDQFVAVGGTMGVYYKLAGVYARNRYFWGSMPHIDEPADKTPKYKALLDYLGVEGVTP